MLDMSPDRLVEARTKGERRMSEKQLENLRKGREAKVAKAKAKLEPQAPDPPTHEPPPPVPHAPKTKANPKSKPRAKP